MWKLKWMRHNLLSLKVNQGKQNSRNHLQNVKIRCDFLPFMLKVFHKVECTWQSGIVKKSANVMFLCWGGAQNTWKGVLCWKNCWTGLGHGGGISFCVHIWRIFLGWQCLLLWKSLSWSPPSPPNKLLDLLEAWLLYCLVTCLILETLPIFSLRLSATMFSSSQVVWYKSLW